VSSTIEEENHKRHRKHKVQFRGVIARKVIATILTGIVVAGCSLYVARRPMDFRVYHYGARGVFDGTKPVYGLTSGLGWPMHYRYPPLFLLLFAPFAQLPLGVAAAIWLVLKATVLAVLVAAVCDRRLCQSWIIPLLLAGPFVIEDFRYGNAQFFVFALTAATFLLCRKRPLLASASLAFGIAIKVWPLFFIPYFIVRNQWRIAAYSLIITLILTLLPSVYFGAGGNQSLLRQWFDQELSTQTGQEEIWFPSQSLRGVLMRYLTVLDYSQVPDSNYPHVNVAGWNPETVRAIWLVTAGAAYVGFLWFAHKYRKTDGWIESALGLCLVGLLEPFTQKYALVILLWPAMIAAGALVKPAARYLIYGSIAFVLIQPVIPGSASTRLMQAMGFDFAATVLLALALITFSQLRYDSLILK
jgi:hypothetical protein